MTHLRSHSFVTRLAGSIGWAAALLPLVLWAAPAPGFTIEHSEARYADEHFRYELIVTLDAPIERVEEVLRDYAEYPALNDRILSSKVLGRPERDVALLETIVEVCLGPFCRNVTRVERVSESKHALLAVADPERSDVRSSETRSELSSTQLGATRVKYVTDVVPDFWIPPLGGRRMMLKVLQTETRDLFLNVEKQARQVKPAAP